MSDNLDLRDLQLCFEGAVPAVIATDSADGTPNITYLSRVRMVDPERVALSNQFFSKTSRNLAENPRACVLVIDPERWDQYRLTLLYERRTARSSIASRNRPRRSVSRSLIRELLIRALGGAGPTSRLSK